eukprot:Rhum_TRINITY_DN12794_c0_g4::Rhum_TRINITY_DN12794_c0_g4_i1::g.54505::m.54505
MEVHRPPALEAVGGGATGPDSERSYRRSPRSQAGDGTSRSRRRRHSLTPSSHSQQRPALTEVLQSAQEMIVALRQQQARKRADERRSPAPGWQQQQQQQQATFYTEETTVHHHSNHHGGTPRGSPHRTHDMMTSPIDDYQQQQQVGYSRHSSVDYVGGEAGVGSPMRRQSSSSVQLHCMESNIQILSPPVSPQRPLQVHQVSYQQTQQTKRTGSSQGSPRRERRSSVSTGAQTTPSAAPVELRGRSTGSGHGSTPPPALRAVTSPYDDSHGDFNSTVPLLPNFEAAAAACAASEAAHTLPSSTPQRSVDGGGGGVRDSGTGPPTPRRDASAEAEAAWLDEEEAGAGTGAGTGGVEEGGGDGAARRVERHDFFPSPQAMRAQERTVARAQWEPPRPEWRYASEGAGGDGRAVTAMRAAANAARAERRREGQESGGGVECGVDMGVLYGRTDANALSTLEAGERYIMMKRAYVHYLAETAMGRPAELPAFCFVSSEKQYAGRQAGGSAASASADLSAAVAASNSNDAHVVDDPASEHGSGGGEEESAAATLRCAARSGSSGDTATTAAAAAEAAAPSEDAVATQHSADSYTDMLPGRRGGPAGWRESRVEDELRVLDRRLSALRGKSAAAAIAGMPGKPLTYLELFRRWGVCHQTRPPGGGRHAIAGRGGGGGGGGAGGALGGLMGLRRDASSTWSAESEVVAELGLDFPSLVGFARAKNGR